MADSDDGFILLPVLWLLALLAGLSLWLTTVTRLDALARERLDRKLELQVLADSFARVLPRDFVSSSGLAKLFRYTGKTVRCSLGPANVVFLVSDAAGMVDINYAPRNVLANLIAHRENSVRDAQTLSAAIIDFRDGDNDRSPDGAEAADYAAAGRDFGPKNAPFETVGELDQVLGMTPETLRRLLSFITVYSGQPFPDATVASRAVLDALSTSDSRTSAGALTIETNNDARGHIFDISISVDDGREIRATRHAVVERSARDPRGFVFREWDLGAENSTLDVNTASLKRDCLHLGD